MRLHPPAKQTNAAEVKMIGSPVVAYSTPYRYVDRDITPELIVDSYKVPIIFSSLSFLNRLCFAGLDFHLESIDGPEDDTKDAQIDQALKQIKAVDKTIARIGKYKAVGTLECIRKAALDTWSFRKFFFEKISTKREGNLYAPILQHLPAQSFYKTPITCTGQPGKYEIDPILDGVVFDIPEGEAHYYQTVDATKEPIEIPSTQIMYAEDMGVPENTSLLHSVISTIEFLKQARHDFRLALQRVGIPMKVASIDGTVLATMKQAQVEIAGGYQTLVDYADDMCKSQSTNQVEVALPGMKFAYPNIAIPINPMEVEKFIEQLIISHFFAKNITEQLQQAISVSAAPGKALLDSVISGYQESAGQPFVDMWQTDFLDVNGYDLTISFDYWSWTPKDQKAEYDRATQVFQAGGSLVNDYRAAQGLQPYDDTQLEQLFAERSKLKGAPSSPFGDFQPEGPIQQQAFKQTNKAKDPVADLLKQKPEIVMDILKETWPEYFDNGSNGNTTAA